MELNNRAQNDESIGVMGDGEFAQPLPVLDALLAYNQQRIGENALMRSLVSHRKWFAPPDSYMSENSIKIGDEAWIFTDEQAARAAHANRPFLDTFVGEISGTELFRAIHFKTKTIRINPHSPAAFSLTLHDTDGDTRAVKTWAAIVRREDSYIKWQRTGEPDRGDFNSYHDFWVFNHSTGPIITLPNRSGMINPAVAFTAPDCVDIFLSKADPKLRSEMESMKVDGRALLEKRQILGIDGLIINVYGPGATYALPFDLLDPASSRLNSIKDAFALLYFLASSDGQIDVREMDIIVDFLSRQHGQLNFDPRQTMSDLAALSSEARIEAYDRAVVAFKAHSSIEDRHTLMHLAAKLALADGSITGNEKILFQDMAKVWDIDLQTFFQQSKSVVAPAAGTAANGMETNRACYHAWLLGSAYSNYLSKVPLLGSSLCQADFEAAKGVADLMGLTINPLQSLDVGGLPVSFGEMMAGNFFTEESQRLVEQMNRQYGSDKVSSYFLIIAKCNLTLARLERAHEAEAVLNEILRLSIHTEIPDDSIEELVSTVRHGVRNFSAFEDSVTKFLFARAAPPVVPRRPFSRARCAAR